MLFAFERHHAAYAQAAPCGGGHDRALVLSGGGAKGAFEAGAIYHLVYQRGCDFGDISGVSVGALNGSYLAQASEDVDSLANLKVAANRLVDFWEGITGPQEVLKPRFLGEVRFFLFGLDSFNDFDGLKDIIAAQIDPSKIRASKRKLRVGVTSFVDGAYHEIEPEDVTDDVFRKYILASTAIPVYAPLPEIDTTLDNGVRAKLQYADGGVSHATPVVGYFSPCNFSQLQLSVEALPSSDCAKTSKPHRPPLKQLFVVIANPYDPRSPNFGSPSTGSSPPTPVPGGSPILDQTINVLTSTSYRWDLNFAITANEMLRWRAKHFPQIDPAARPASDDFPIRSANPGPDGITLPYDMVIIGPPRPYSDVYGFDRANIQLQLHKGCVWADDAIVHAFHVASMQQACTAKFPISPAQLQAEADPVEP